MLGAIIGDVVGSRFEFDNIKTKEFSLLGQDTTYTDDSVLTVAVADWALNVGNLKDERMAASYLQKWARKYPNAGYGSSFYVWKDLENPKPYYSCGNGSAMRISSVGWLFDDYKEMLKVCNTITSVTHNHPEGIKGARVTATMIYKARNGATRDELRMYATAEYPEIAKFDYEELRQTFVHGEEICQATVPQAIYCFLISNSFEDCLRTTISIGGDCDTTSAISCAIAEAYYKYIDKDIVRDILPYLESDMVQIVRQFYSRLERRDIINLL